MKTPHEERAETARQAATIIVAGPDGRELVRFEGVAAWMIGVIGVDGEAAMNSRLGPENASGLIDLLHTRYVTIPNLARLQPAPRIVVT